MYNKIKEEYKDLSEDEINILALKELDDNRNFRKSFYLYYYNAEKYKSWRAHHNLGWYYYEFGRYSLDQGKEYGVDQQRAEKHLNIALSMHANYHTRCELGWIYYMDCKYVQAKEMYEKSFQYQSTYYNNNMLGCTLLQLKQYTQAEPYLRFAYNHSLDKEMKYFVLGNYGVCMALEGKSEALEIGNFFLELYIKKQLVEYLPAAVYIFYNFSQYEMVLKCLQYIRPKIAIDKESFKIYILSYYKINPDEIDAFYKDLATEADNYSARYGKILRREFHEIYMDIINKKAVFPEFQPYKENENQIVDQCKH